MLWHSSKMSGNLRNSAKFFENLRNSSKFFEILQNSSKICEILRNSSKFPRKKNIFEEIIKDSKGFSIFWEDSIAAGIDFYRILLKSFDFIGFSQCPMGRGSGGPPTFSQKIPVGFHSEINLSAKGMRKRENGEKFLRFRDQNLKHLPACGLLLRFRGESKKVVWGYMGVHRDRNRGR